MPIALIDVRYRNLSLELHEISVASVARTGAPHPLIVRLLP
jgi:hypothetical protein